MTTPRCARPGSHDPWEGKLQEYGFSVHTGIGGTGVTGVLANGSGPTVLLRAELDALPIREDTGVDYASTATAKAADGHEVPVDHACGHDTHVACLLGMAKLMAGHPGQWNGTLIPLFQPAEETGDGAQGMVDDGLLKRIPPPTWHYLSVCCLASPGPSAHIPYRSCRPKTAARSPCTGGAPTAAYHSTPSTRWCDIVHRQRCSPRSSGSSAPSARPAAHPRTLTSRPSPASVPRQRPCHHGPGGGRLRCVFRRQRPRTAPPDRQRGLRHHSRYREGGGGGGGTETLVTAALAWLTKLCRTDLAPADLSLHAAAHDERLRMPPERISYRPLGS